MSVLVNEEPRLVVQGITGSAGSFHSRQLIEYGTQVVAGVTPGRGGQKFEDKVPILGNIPFIGRLFRSEGERALQRNLIMFVTARKMNPNGQINFERSFGQTNPPGADAE